MCAIELKGGLFRKADRYDGWSVSNGYVVHDGAVCVRYGVSRRRTASSRVRLGSRRKRGRVPDCVDHHIMLQRSQQERLCWDVQRYTSGGTHEEMFGRKKGSEVFSRSFLVLLQYDMYLKHTSPKGKSTFPRATCACTTQTYHNICNL